MPTTFMGKYPKLVRYKTLGSYPGCIAFMRDAGSGVILHIPTPAAGANANLSLLESVTITNTEVDDYPGGVVIRSSADPALIA